MSIWIGILIGMFGASWWLRRLSDRWHVPPAVTPLFLAAALVPYAIEVLLRVSGSAGLPLEMVVLSSIQVVACSMAATSCWRRFQPLTMVLNLFVILFAASISNDLATSLSTGAFALFAFGWLFVVYWHSLVSRVQKDKRKIKIRWTMIVCLAGVFGLLIIAGGVRSSRIWALAGFMPSSGGDGGQDDAAYRGVGDGENLVS
ncbi:MAG: hypothetical protein FJ267_09955, partial [Planctomycetes bacterium]|nr:hypothetical protein [Planctomycetota bacterium]